MLEKRQRLAQEAKRQKIKGVPAEFDASARDYQFDIEDPELDDNVINYDAHNLYELYQHTDHFCGARFLWADAMALGGDRIEDFLEKTRGQGLVWHRDLLFNVMSSSLRMVRRKLTLKLEESTEGAWCKRYHEHTKHGMPCYRELAWEQSNKKDNDTEDKGRDGGGGAERARMSESVDVDGNFEWE